MTQQVIVSHTTVRNTASESSPLTVSSHGANYLEVGKMEEIALYGSVAQRANPAAVLTVRVKYAGATVQTIATPANTVINANTPFMLRITMTVRSIGNPGSVQMNSWFQIDGITNTPDAATLMTPNTTTANNTTVTFQWGEANVADTITVNQGRVLCVEQNR
jgi:hypothetical protein